jgi:transcriptional regulator with XRE-family HTH domain
MPYKKRWDTVRVREADGSGLALFAAELRATRAKAGLSQAELAAKINYSESLVASIETLRRAPTQDVAERIDSALDTAGTFARLQQFGGKGALPAWFKPYADIEVTARAQLRHLAELSLRPNITIEVVPLSTGAHGGLLGAFDIAVIADLMLTFDTLRGEALPRKGSHDLIMKWAGEYGRPE